MVATAVVLRQQYISSADGLAMKKRSNRHGLGNEILDRQVMICKAFANSTRLHILDLLGKRDWTAAEIQKELGISKANLSQHATVLRAAGVVIRRREGKQVHFSLAMPEVKQACQLIQHVLRAQIRNGQKLV